MAQNIYDDPQFFAGYSRLARFGEGWTGAFEHASFMALLPDVAGKRVVDLGCGAGQLASHLAGEGALSAVGVDLSRRMLALAMERRHPRAAFLRASLDNVDFAAGSFDLAVSSLAVHYVEDFAALCRRVAAWLRPGGTYVYSTEHPVYLSRATREGWIPRADGSRAHWALDRYGEEGLREETWIVAGVRKYHRMVSTQLNALIEAGFVIERVLEPMPDGAMLARHPEWRDESRRPFCLLVRASKPGQATPPHPPPTHAHSRWEPGTGSWELA